MVTREQVEKLEQAALNLLGLFTEALEGERFTKDELYENPFAQRLSDIESSIQQEWIHLGRLKKRVHE